MRRRAEARRAFPIVAERRRDRAGALSGGQQKIVEIARALMLEPRLILMDEPSMGLDPKARALVFETITRLNGEREQTVLLVEQNARAGLTIAHRGAVMDGGTVALAGRRGRAARRSQGGRAVSGRRTSRGRRHPRRAERRARSRRRSECGPPHNPAMGSSVTLRDVAELARVHPGTVSRALNEQTRALVNEETAQRVLRAAEQLGYQPNPIARSLKTSRSFTVGVLVPDLTNPLFPPIVRGIEDVLAAAGYTSLIANTDNDPARERHPTSRRCAPARWTASSSPPRALRRPAAARGRRRGRRRWCWSTAASRTWALPAVAADDRAGVELAVEHLAALGHRGSRTWPARSTSPPARRGRRPSATALRGHGLAPTTAPDRVARPTRRRRAPGAAASCSTPAPTVTAIVAGNDLLALGCYDALDERGLSLPRRLSHRRLQRHAVRRPVAPAAHHRARSRIRDRPGGGAAAARAAGRA